MFPRRFFPKAHFPGRYFPKNTIVIVVTVPTARTGGGGMRYARSQIIKHGEKITREQLLRDDEELVLMIISIAVAENQ